MNFLKCQKCGTILQESLIEESHDVPCYLFEGNRKGRKNQADKFGRHQLCQKCHKDYEDSLKIVFIDSAKRFVKIFFREEEWKEE